MRHRTSPDVRHQRPDRHDLAGNLTSEVDFNGTPTTNSDADDTYRADGYLTEIGDHPRGRVNTVQAGGRNESYVYDVTGNLTHARWLADD